MNQENKELYKPNSTDCIEAAPLEWTTPRLRTILTTKDTQGKPGTAAVEANANYGVS